MLRGVVILQVFASLWWAIGLHVTGHGAALSLGVPCAVAIIAATVVRKGLPHNHADATENARRRRTVGRASAAEGVAIAVAVGTLARFGYREYVVPTIVLIVAAHFLPLARWLPVKQYYATAATLTLVGIAGFCVSDLSQRIAWTSAGTAAILWVTSLSVLWSLQNPKNFGASASAP